VWRATKKFFLPLHRIKQVQVIEEGDYKKEHILYLVLLAVCYGGIDLLLLHE
jgi:hypothetical protein